MFLRNHCVKDEEMKKYLCLFFLCTCLSIWGEQSLDAGVKLSPRGDLGPHINLTIAPKINPYVMLISEFGGIKIYYGIEIKPFILEQQLLAKAGFGYKFNLSDNFYIEPVITGYYGVLSKKDSTKFYTVAGGDLGLKGNLLLQENIWINISIGIGYEATRAYTKSALTLPLNIGIEYKL